jgi:hypothetical protein
MRFNPKQLILFFLVFIMPIPIFGQGKIDREKIMERHTITITEVDTLNSLTLGNGRFAMTMDVTGLQTFPLEYSKGVPLGTLSEWGWHSFPAKRSYSIDETLESTESHGRKVPYARQWPANTTAGEAANYIRMNPHRIHLGTLGLYLLMSDGTKAQLSDIKNIKQKLDVWKGELVSQFTLEGIAVEVISLIDQNSDKLGVSIRSELLSMGRLGITIRYPYPSNSFLDEASVYDSAEMDRLRYGAYNSQHIFIERLLDDTKYYTQIQSSLNYKSKAPILAGYKLIPETSGDIWTFYVSFAEKDERALYTPFDVFRRNVADTFKAFWCSGGIIDFGDVKDFRAKELERRMVLSMYLTRINCGGYSPPQETGLTYNSWFGRPHLEMEWWHGVHFALWGHPEILEKQMDWYLRNDSIAREIAIRQGFSGVRWQKMTDNNGGETVSSIGSYLIWQQPHIIYFAELIYGLNKNDSILDKYHRLIEETAGFMADFAWFDSVSNRYILGPGIIPAQERFDPKTTINPTFELAYWRWALETAQLWRERKGLHRNAKWDDVLLKLSPLPAKDELYLATESCPDSYTNPKYMTDHPGVLAAYGMLPATTGLDLKVMQNTFDTIWADWKWDETWGWDFPMTAMTATRLGKPDKAIDALLMPVKTNTYLKNGHNYQNETLRIYLPGNGGFLTALAMMATCTSDTKKPLPGFPDDWDIKYEGLNSMP